MTTNNVELNLICCGLRPVSQNVHFYLKWKCVPCRIHVHVSPLSLSFSLLVEDAYRIDVEVDGEVVGLDIIDTAGQVSY